jgi:heme/copper-type cytochrome/quinol oxidase subunit 4
MFIQAQVALQSFIHDAQARLEDEEGQTFVEWLGVLAIIVLIVGAVAALAPGLGNAIGGVAQKAIDAVGNKIA